MIKRLILTILLCSGALWAQSGGSGGVRAVGTRAVNDCVKFASQNTITSAGAACGTGGGVTSFNSRTGAVVPVASDYGLGLIGQPAAGTSFTYATDQTSAWVLQGTGKFTVTGGGGFSANLYSTATNCAAAGSAANPSVAACSAAPGGAFSCATNASTGTCQVTSTAITTSSNIWVQPTGATATGTRLSVTCNTTSDTGLTAPRINAIASGSFTINLGTFTTNPECFMWGVFN